MTSVEWREQRKVMKKKITVLTLCAMLLALCSSAEAQQATKIPQDWLSNWCHALTAKRRASRRFAKDCASLATWRGKTLSLSGDMRRENSIVYPRSRLSWCVSR